VKGRGGPFKGPSCFFLSSDKCVDGRIFYAGTRQLSELRTQDLPLLAKAICGYERGMVHVEQCCKHQVEFLRLHAPNFEVFVLTSDWKRIVPYLATGWMTPGVVAPQPVHDRLHDAFCASLDLADLETWDKTFYQKVLATLQTLFTESYPTSKL
jgi:hypothetical protein